ncbi:hypothetical protein UYO_0313 [Lachnospiraceae bacterium JC7]|nr:hypothetical protein UYO_0313 [Lachnospiraceae bacterium JC7]
MNNFMKKTVASAMMLCVASTGLTSFAGTFNRDFLEAKFGIDYENGKSTSSDFIDRASQENIANSMSTTDTALAMDFDWLIDKAYNISRGEWPNAIDEQFVDRVNGDEPYLLNGGWKCYMCSAGSDHFNGYERYLNAVIDTDGYNFSVKLNWDAFSPGDGSPSIFESGYDIGKGKWNSKTATVHTVADIGNIDFSDFYISKNRDEEYAVGTVTWSSGEVDHIGLMRMTPEKAKEYYDMGEGDEVGEKVLTIVDRAKKLSGAPEAEIQWDDDHTISIRMYEYVNDGGGVIHETTWTWYTVNVSTMKGTDFFGNAVDFSK